MKLYELRRLDYRSLIKIAVVLGVLWGVIRWVLGGIAVILIKMFDSSADPSLLPPAFAFTDLLFTLLASTIGSVITAALSAYAYNLFAGHFGGITLGFHEIDQAPVASKKTPIKKGEI